MTPATAVQEREAPATQVSAPEAPAVPECRHHWLIESPQGATSWGMCKLCGSRREFSNSSPDAFWEGPSVPTAQRDPVTSASVTRASIEDDEGF